MKRKIASAISVVLSPFLMGLALIVLVSSEATVSAVDAIKWSLVITSLTVLPTFAFALYLVRKNRLDSIFANVRKQRTKVYAVSAILAGAGYIILLSLKAPSILLAMFVTGFSVTIIFMCVNLWWKISVHTAFITASVTVMLILYGFMASASIILIPLVAWARMELEHHSLAQVVTGTLLAPPILVVVFHIFALV